MLQVMRARALVDTECQGLPFAGPYLIWFPWRAGCAAAKLQWQGLAETVLPAAAQLPDCFQFCGESHVGGCWQAANVIIVESG